MNFKIVHETIYSFDDEVFLEPHYLRFRPKQTPFIKVNNFAISLKAEPEGHRIIQDEEHNTIDFYWFEQQRKGLTITAETSLQTSEYNPFDFIIYPDSFNTLPLNYSKHQQQMLYASLQKAPLAKRVTDYADAVLNAVNSQTIDFVTNLTSTIHRDFTVEYRESGAPLSPNETFDIKKGSCRDLSWMQISILRNYGIASRFVSGYFYFEMEQPVYELHAWVEVFIPGTGWLGFDPSHGILTGSTHLSVASSAFPENTMPVTGGVRGSAKSQLKTSLVIEKN